jgi:CRP-like cAMP-binding protein
MTTLDSLRQSPLLATLGDENLELLAPYFSEVELPAAHVLIQPRSAGSGLYVLCEGTVVVQAYELERELGPGEVVGEISLLTDEGTRSARVTAKTPVRALALRRHDYEQVLREIPELGAALQKLAEKRLGELEASH